MKNAAGYARRCLAQSLNLRNTPELRFILDESIEYGIEMSKKIDALTGGSKRKSKRMDMISLDSYLEGIHTVAISGHIRPDGDCVGSCLAVYNYICDNYPTLWRMCIWRQYRTNFCF